MAFGSPATVPFYCNSHDASGMHYAVIGFVCVCVCVCVCVDVCVHVRSLWLHFDIILRLFFDHLGWFGALFFGFWLPFIRYLAIWRVSGPRLGAVGSPWAPGCPQEGSNERKAGSLDLPLGSLFRLIFASFLYFFHKKCIQTNVMIRSVLGAILEANMEPKSIQNQFKM